MEVEGAVDSRAHRRGPATLIVVDASLILSLFFDDEINDFSKLSASRLLKETALVPPIFPAEIANALHFASRKKRLSERDLRTAMERIVELPIRIESYGFDLSVEFNLAKRYELTVYDAMYLALAQRRGIPLLTRDAALQRAAVAEGRAAT